MKLQVKENQMQKVRKTIWLLSEVAEHLDKKAKEKNTTISALVEDLIKKLKWNHTTLSESNRPYKKQTWEKFTTES